MPIVGFNFTKISAQRLNPPEGNIKINNNVSIKEVTKTELNMGPEKQAGLKFTFGFITKYEPKIAEIDLEGELYFSDSNEKIKSVLEKWKKNKKVDDAFIGEVLNTILNKCNVQALIISQDINVPPPIPLPKLEDRKETNNYIG